MTINEEIKDTKELAPGKWVELKLDCPHCTSDQFVYLYEDNKNCYCVQCDEEFDISDLTDGTIEAVNIQGKADSTEDKEIQIDLEQRLNDMVSDDPEVVKEMADRILDTTGKDMKELNLSLPGHKHKGKMYHSGQYTFMSCTHTPQHIIAGEGWGVWAGKKEDCRRFAKDYDVVLNLTFTSIKEPHIIPIKELEEFAEVGCSYKEIQLDWPDYGVIDMPKEFWTKLLAYLEKNKLKLLVFCLGGHGRTGTALAVLMSLSLEYTADDSMKWIREHYCSSAIETEGQEAYVKRMVGDIGQKVQKAGAGKE